MLATFLKDVPDEEGYREQLEGWFASDRTLAELRELHKPHLIDAMCREFPEDADRIRANEEGKSCLVRSLRVVRRARDSRRVQHEQENVRVAGVATACGLASVLEAHLTEQQAADAALLAEALFGEADAKGTLEDEANLHRFVAAWKDANRKGGRDWRWRAMQHLAALIAGFRGVPPGSMGVAPPAPPTGGHSSEAPPVAPAADGEEDEQQGGGNWKCQPTNRGYDRSRSSRRAPGPSASASHGWPLSLREEGWEVRIALRDVTSPTQSRLGGKKLPGFPRWVSGVKHCACV